MEGLTVRCRYLGWVCLRQLRRYYWRESWEAYPFRISTLTTPRSLCHDQGQLEVSAEGAFLHTVDGKPVEFYGV
jgi:hypothetical protein